MTTEQETYFEVRRLQFDKKLCGILGSDHVYFQPPESIQLKYPCIIYQRNNVDIEFANNRTYNSRIQYLVTIIDEDPDSIIIDKLMKNFSMCNFSRHYVADNLNHDMFVIYY
jgi:hypothetical protein